MVRGGSASARMLVLVTVGSFALTIEGLECLPGTTKISSGACAGTRISLEACFDDQAHASACMAAAAAKLSDRVDDCQEHFKPACAKLAGTALETADCRHQCAAFAQLQPSSCDAEKKCKTAPPEYNYTISTPLMCPFAIETFTEQVPKICCSKHPTYRPNSPPTAGPATNLKRCDTGGEQRATSMRSSPTARGRFARIFPSTSQQESTSIPGAESVRFVIASSHQQGSYSPRHRYLKPTYQVRSARMSRIAFNRSRSSAAGLPGFRIYTSRSGRNSRNAHSTRTKSTSRVLPELPVSSGAFLSTPCAQVTGRAAAVCHSQVRCFAAEVPLTGLCTGRTLKWSACSTNTKIDKCTKDSVRPTLPRVRGGA